MTVSRTRSASGGGASMGVDWLFLGVAAFAAALVALVAYERLDRRRKALLFLFLTIGFFALMELVMHSWGYGAAWNIFALVFIGLGAYHSEKVWMKMFWRERQDWEGHPTQNPETEEFSDVLKLTTNHLTGQRHGLVLSGPYDERYLADLSDSDLNGLAADLAARDPKGAAMLAAYRTWKAASPQ